MSIVKRIIFLLAILLFLVTPSSVRAITVAPGFPGGNPALGQHHAYSLTLRGNGEAVVGARIAFYNTADPPQNTIEFGTEANLPEDLVVYQITYEEECIRYSPYPTGQSVGFVPECLEYSKPDYTYHRYNAEYHEATYTKEGNTLRINLPVEVEADGQGAVFVYYRTGVYTEKNTFGVWDYNFTTFSSDTNINNISVGINTDEDYVLKNADSGVDYAQPAMLSVDAGRAESTALDNYIGSMGYGAITKHASDLAPGETFELAGAYADSNLKLYALEIMYAGLAIIAILLLLLAVARLLLVGRLNKKELKNETTAKLVVSVLASFISALLIVAYSVVVYFIFNALSGGGYYNYQLIPLATLLIGLLSILFYLILFIGPAVYIGFKRGVEWGFVTVGMTVVWLMILIAIVLGVIFVLRPNVDPRPIPFGASEREIQMDSESFERAVDSTSETAPDAVAPLRPAEFDTSVETPAPFTE